MKAIKLLTTLTVILFSLNAMCQNLEPDFIGEVNLVKNDGTAMLLEKKNAQIKTKAGASMYIVGIGKIKSRLTVQGPVAATRINKNDSFKLIIRGVDNNSDPLSIISIFKFEKKAKERRAELSSLATFGGQSDNNLNRVQYTAKKYGEACYEVIIQVIEAGEYGITVTNPNNKDEKNLIVACLGIDE
ncbi:MAG: hypothetical protein EOM31_05010 [Bacteroidia bacterium]|nr:hypothetical protein [Bacteroidia bacterium]